MLNIEVGKNPPIVTVTALGLIKCFREASKDTGGDAFKTFLVIAGYAIRPEKHPLPQSFSEVGLTGPAKELESFFENGTLTPDTKEALILLLQEENASGSDLGKFLALAKETFN